MFLSFDIISAIIIEFSTSVETEIERVQYHNDGEYTSNEVKKRMKTRSVFLLQTTPYSPDMIGEDEILNRIVIDAAWSILSLLWIINGCLK